MRASSYIGYFVICTLCFLIALQAVGEVEEKPCAIPPPLSIVCQEYRRSQHSVLRCFDRRGAEFFVIRPGAPL